MNDFLILFFVTRGAEGVSCESIRKSRLIYNTSKVLDFINGILTNTSYRPWSFVAHLAGTHVYWLWGHC